MANQLRQPFPADLSLHDSTDLADQPVLAEATLR